MATLTRRLLVTAVALAACTGGEAEVFNDPSTADGGTEIDVRMSDAMTTSDGATGARDAQPREDATVMLPPLRDDAVAQPTWREAVESLINSSDLNTHFQGAGYALPSGSAVYALRVSPGAGYAAYEAFDAGDGAFDMSFWPASTIKLLAALAALEWVYSLGYTGAAQVDWDSGFGDQLRAIYTRSITVSSNIDYDRTLRAAGWDFTNADFLSAERGFPRTVITSSYASVEVRNPGGYTLSEGGSSEYVPGRAGVGEYGRNDTDLYELVEGARRVMLDAEVPEDERFRIDPVDLAAVQDALCDATPSYFSGGAATALGGSPTICHKPGWVPDNECLDFGLVTDGGGNRYLIAASVPYSANCPELSSVARHTLEFLRDAPRSTPLQAEFGDIVVQIDADSVRTECAEADEIELWDGASLVGRAPTDRGQSAFVHTLSGPSLLTVVAYSGGNPIAHRAANFDRP